MEKPIKKFLEFNGKAIYFLSIDGTYYVALKPIVEALGLDWRSHHKALKKSKLLGAASSNQTMQIDEKQGREYTCMPEKYVYGWLFRLESTAPGFEEFQMKCYELLYDYFHGVLTHRISTLTAKIADKTELVSLQRELADSEQWKRMEVLKKRINGHGRDLRELDAKLSESQMSIFN